MSTVQVGEVLIIVDEDDLHGRTGLIQFLHTGEIPQSRGIMVYVGAQLSLVPLVRVELHSLRLGVSVSPPHCTR